jgi:hypothetical protein
VVALKHLTATLNRKGAIEGKFQFVSVDPKSCYKLYALQLLLENNDKRQQQQTLQISETNQVKAQALNINEKSLSSLLVLLLLVLWLSLSLLLWLLLWSLLLLWH